jgi:hypothetical protein
VEVTQSKVYIDAFKRRQRGTKLAGGDRMKILQIRVGRYDEEGETSKASLQLKDGVDPPSLFNIRTAQRNLRATVKNLIESTLDDEWDKVKAVMDWVDLKQLEEGPNLYSDPDDTTGGANTGTPNSTTPSTNNPTCAVNNSNPTTNTPSAAIVDDVPTVDDALTVDDVQISIPTPKTCTTLYDADHSNAKYKNLNSLGVDLMNRDSGVNALKAKGHMQGVLSDIVSFKNDNNEPLEFQTWNGQRYCLIQMPVDVDANVDVAKERGRQATEADVAAGR